MVKKAIPKKVKREIDRYIKTLKDDKLPIKKVILFGSYAKGRPRQWSDIDLCIVSSKFKDPFDAMQYLWLKRDIFDVNYTIEPIGFSPKDFKDDYDSPLIYEIKRTGIEVSV